MVLNSFPTSWSKTFGWCFSLGVLLGVLGRRSLPFGGLSEARKDISTPAAPLNARPPPFCVSKW